MSALSYVQEREARRKVMTDITGIGMSQSDVIHKVIGNTCIVEFGIIKEVLADGVVSVEMSVADKASDIIICTCTYVNLASSSFTLNIKPNVNDKVLVLFPRKYNVDMFNPDNKEAILSECSDGYSFTCGMALPVNQFQPAHHKNVLDISDGKLDIKLVSDKLTLTTDEDGYFSLASNGCTIVSSDDGIDINGHLRIKK